MKAPVAAAFVIALVAGAGYGGYRYAMHRMTSAAPASPQASAPATDRRVLYWHDPMYPQQKFDKPGKSPFMDMELVPVYAEENAGDAASVKVSPQLAQNLGVRTAIAERGKLAATTDALGTVAFDERAVAVVQARTAAFVEELFVRAPLDPVRAGQPLARLFVPEWTGAQHEYLALRAQAGGGMEDLARAARNRLLLLGMTEAQVAAVERDAKPSSYVTLTAPIGGIIAELGARQGMNVAAGATLFRIN